LQRSGNIFGRRHERPRWSAAVGSLAADWQQCFQRGRRTKLSAWLWWQARKIACPILIRRGEIPALLHIAAASLFSASTPYFLRLPSLAETRQYSPGLLSHNFVPFSS